jgi:hypothetical protein
LILQAQRAEIFATAKARIADAEAIFQQRKALQAVLTLLGPLGAKAGEALSKDAFQSLQTARETLTAIESASNKNLGGSTAGGLSEGASTGGGAASRQNELNNVFQRYESIITGVEQKEIDRKRVIDDLTGLLGTKYIPNQQALTDAIKRYDESLAANAENVELWSFDVDAATKRAAENIQDNLADFLFDPFENGLRGMLLGFVNTLRRMAAEAAAANILKGVFGGGEGGGIFGDLFKKVFTKSDAVPIGDIFGGFFANGGYLEPGKIGVVGERGPELVLGGNTGKTIIPNNKIGGGGNTYNIDARGADQGAVLRLEQALQALAGPGVIERRVATAQVRGSL